MHSGSPLRRASGVLVGALALALIVAWVSSWPCNSGERISAEVDSHGNTAVAARNEVLQPTEAAPRMAAIDTHGDAQFARPQAIAVAAEVGAIRLRFVRGSSGTPVPDLPLHLFDLPADQAAQSAGQSSLLAQGRTDEHGLFFAPASLRTHRFLIDVDSGDGSVRSTVPAFFAPESMPADGAVIDVHVLGAWAQFEALVLDQRGRPVVGAQVQFDFESPALAFSTHDAPSQRAPTNASGQAQIELVDRASAGGRMRIKAEFGADLHSETVELPPPLSSARVELHLSTSSSAIVRAISAKGAPLAGAMARVELLDAPFTSVGRSTDGEGTANFLPLEPGRYVASVEDPATHSSTHEEFNVASCQVADLRLTLPPCELPLAVAGHVRGADGRPITWLRVSICVDGREEARLTPDRDGHFEYHRERCEHLRVRLQASFDGPVIDPEVVEASFGTENLAFVLSDAPRMGFTALRVVDSENGQALRGVAACVFRDSAAERIGGVVSALAGSALSLVSNEDGLLFVPSGAQLPRAHVVIEKRGFVRRELDLSDLASLPERDGRPSLELVRGYVHRWVVLDAGSGAPIAGAIASHGVDPFSGLSIDDGSTWIPSAPSDARGVLELSLPQAPSRVSILARGYLPRAVDAGFASQVIGAALALSDVVLLDSALEH